MADAYRKVGRGGAGNFYTKEDIEATQQQHEVIDSESQVLFENMLTSHLIRTLRPKSSTPQIPHPTIRP